MSTWACQAPLVPRSRAYAHPAGRRDSRPMRPHHHSASRWASARVTEGTRLESNVSVANASHGSGPRHSAQAARKSRDVERLAFVSRPVLLRVPICSRSPSRPRTLGAYAPSVLGAQDRGRPQFCGSSRRLSGRTSERAALPRQLLRQTSAPIKCSQAIRLSATATLRPMRWAAPAPWLGQTADRCRSAAHDQRRNSRGQSKIR
jgi:hypothetical protein